MKRFSHAAKCNVKPWICYPENPHSLGWEEGISELASEPNTEYPEVLQSSVRALLCH